VPAANLLDRLLLLEVPPEVLERELLVEEAEALAQLLQRPEPSSTSPSVIRSRRL